MFKYYSIFLMILFVSSHTYSNSASKNLKKDKSTAENPKACDLSSINTNFQLAIENLKNKTNQLNQLLTGEDPKKPSAQEFSPQSFFGHGFDISQTDEKIIELKSVLDNPEAVLLEYQTLNFCLKKLNLNKKSSDLRIVTEKYIQGLIEILEKNLSLNDSFRKSEMAGSELPEIRKEIDKESTEALKAKSELENKLIIKENQSLKETSLIEREFIEYEKRLTKIKIQLLNIKLQVNANLEERIKQFEDLSLQLKQVSSGATAIENAASVETLKQLFQKVESIWLSLSSENYFEIFTSNNGIELPNIPEELDLDSKISLPSRIVEARTELIKLRTEIIKNHTDKKNQELKLLNYLVSNSSAIRQNIHEKLGSMHLIYSLNDFKILKSLKNEIVSAPFRAVSFFYSKYLFLREQLRIGREGYVRLFSLFGYFVLLGLLLFLIKHLILRINLGIDGLFDFLLRRQKFQRITHGLFGIWRKFKEISSYFLWLFALSVMNIYGLFDSFPLVIEIIQVYLASKIIKSLVTVFLGSISRLDSTNFYAFKKKANETSDRFKNIFLLTFLSMIFIEISVGKVYLYDILQYLIFFYSLWMVINETSRWEIELKKYAERMFSGIIVEKFFSVLNFFPKITHPIALLTFVLAFMLFKTFSSLTDNLELSKKISANLFKKQIENIEAEDGADENIPASYKELFALQSISHSEEYVSSDKNLENRLLTEVSEWQNEKAGEHSLVIYGDKGIGKTTLLKHLQHSLLSDDSLDVEVRYSKVPPKTTCRNDLNKFLANLFNVEMVNANMGNEEFNIYTVDKSLEKNTVVILDECQNIFLAKTGGFENYYEMIDIINRNTSKIFWVMSFNRYSWLYLDRAFGKTQFFRNIFELTGWSDSKIKELIFKRHSKSKYKLSYDLLINATRSQDEIDKYASVESKFFKLLWELSRGNPRSALHLWKTALSRKNFSTFNVNIPKTHELEGLSKMPDDLLFVLSYIFKHENLSREEVVESTNLAAGVVRNSLRLALENKYLYRDENFRYMIDISGQHGLIRYLKSKNFIYGN